MCEVTNLNVIGVAVGAGSGRDITFMSIFLCSVDNICSSSGGGIALFLFAFLVIHYHFYYYFLPFVLCISINFIFTRIILNGNQRVISASFITQSCKTCRQDYVIIIRERWMIAQDYGFVSSLSITSKTRRPDELFPPPFEAGISLLPRQQDSAIIVVPFTDILIHYTHTHARTHSEAVMLSCSSFARHSHEHK